MILYADENHNNNLRQLFENISKDSQHGNLDSVAQSNITEALIKTATSETLATLAVEQELQILKESAKYGYRSGLSSLWSKFRFNYRLSLFEAYITEQVRLSLVNDILYFRKTDYLLRDCPLLRDVCSDDLENLKRVVISHYAGGSFSRKFAIKLDHELYLLMVEAKQGNRDEMLAKIEEISTFIRTSRPGCLTKFNALVLAVSVLALVVPMFLPSLASLAFLGAIGFLVTLRDVFKFSDAHRQARNQFFEVEKSIGQFFRQHPDYCYTRSVKIFQQNKQLVANTASELANRLAVIIVEEVAIEDSHQSEIIRILAEFHQANPDISIDENFISRLERSCVNFGPDSSMRPVPLKAMIRAKSGFLFQCYHQWLGEEAQTEESVESTCAISP